MAGGENQWESVIYQQVEVRLRILINKNDSRILQDF